MYDCEMTMDSDDDMDFENENDEFLEAETRTLALLRDKTLAVQNADGTLRCPLSASGMKQAYAHKDLLQHATALASGKRGSEAAGQHSALKKFLESDLISLSTPAPERLLNVQRDKLLRRRHGADMLVSPWSIVVYNIDNSQTDSTQSGLVKSELDLYFKDFKPDEIHVLWGPQGHLGMCVLHFGTELSGFKNAQALENSFLDNKHGLRHYARRSASGTRGTDFYGWLAREEDVNGRFGRRGDEIGTYLAKVGNLKDIGMVGDEMKHRHERQVRQLARTVSKMNKESEDLKTQMKIVRRTAEADRQQLVDAHRIELEAVQSKARNSEEEYNRATSESRRALENKEAELCRREKELREKESHLTSATEKTILENQLITNIHLREVLSKQRGILQKKNTDQIRLIRKHEETRQLIQLIQKTQKETLELANWQKNEMEKEQLHTLLETEKLFNKLTSSPTGDESKKVEEIDKKQRFEKMERTLEELESADEALSALTLKERAANDEILEARNSALQVLKLLNEQGKELVESAFIQKNQLEKEKKPSKYPQPRVEVKMAGEIYESPWAGAFQKKYGMDGDWRMKMKLSLAQWEGRIRNPEFQPFRIVEIREAQFERQIDHGNEQLSDLKKQVGEKVYSSVTTALMEIEEYNASGRYPIPVAWVFEKSRRASLKETVEYFGEVIGALLQYIVTQPRKKPRNDLSIDEI